MNSLEGTFQSNQITKEIVLLQHTTLVIWSQGFMFYVDETTFFPSTLGQMKF